MSGSEVLVIEGAFVVALGLMAAGVMAGGLTGRWRRDAIVGPGRVAPTGLMPIDLAGVMVVAAVYFGFHWMAAHAAPAAEDDPGITPTAIVLSVLTQVMIVGMVAVIVLPRCEISRFFGLRWSQWPWVVLIGPAGAVAAWFMIGGLQLGGYFGWMQDWLEAEPIQESVTLLRESTNPILLVLMAVAAVVVAPLCEEIVFRGYVYPVVKRYGGSLAAALGSSLLFAAAHSHAVGLMPLMLLGLILVAAYEVTGSIWAPVAIHACFNGATVGLTALMRLLDIPMEMPQ